MDKGHPRNRRSNIIILPRIVTLAHRAYNGVKQKQRRRGKVTQIIAALAKNRTSIVMVADRMVSDEEDTLHFEHEPKGQMLSYNAMVLTSGTMHEPEIINLSREEIAGRAKITSMVDILAKRYRDARKKRIEIEILSKHGFMSFDEYHNKQKNVSRGDCGEYRGRVAVRGK